MPRPDCPKGKIRTKIQICREPAGRTECPPGTTPTLTCRKTDPTPRRPSYKLEEAKRLKTAIGEIEAEARVFTQQMVQEYENAPNTSERTDQLFRAYIQMTLDIPAWIQYAINHMLDKEQIINTPDPLRRYDAIVRKSNQNAIGGSPITKLNVLKITLRHYVHRNTPPVFTSLLE